MARVKCCQVDAFTADPLAGIRRRSVCWNSPATEWMQPVAA